MDVIFIAEKFDASLITLRRRLNWSYLHIFYHRTMVLHSDRFNISEAAQYKLLSAQVNLGDMLLYEAMVDAWGRQPEVSQTDFWKEVGILDRAGKIIELSTDTSASQCFSGVVFHKY